MGTETALYDLFLYYLLAHKNHNFVLSIYVYNLNLYIKANNNNMAIKVHSQKKGYFFE